jgi:hypothetical protein
MIVIKELKNCGLFMLSNIILIIALTSLILYWAIFLIICALLLFFLPIESMIMGNTNIISYIHHNLVQFNGFDKISRIHEYICNKIRSLYVS